MIDVAALILAGGRASRMGGVDKTALVVDGESIFARQTRVLAPLVSEIIVSSPRDIENYRTVRDVADGVGPLAGIAAGLEAATTEWLLVIAGDMPNLSEAALRLLFDRGGDEASAFRIGGRPEPLCSLLRVVPAKRAAHELIAKGQMRAGALLEELRVAWVEEEQLRAVDPALATIKSINTPADLWDEKPGLHHAVDAVEVSPSMRIGDLTVDVPVILAPMAAVTDLPFRTVCEEFGVGLTITEFLSAHALSSGDKKTESKLTASLDGRQFGVQIFGREPEMMDKAAKMAIAIGASLVDINMGCPAKRVVAGECGSALMREPMIAQELVRAVVNAVPANVPVTVKHRAGWDQAHRNAPEFACAMVEAGAKMITVHGRTRTQGFSGKSDPEIIRMVRDALPAHIPLVGNGDVITVDDYLRMREVTGCDAVMIGRGALGNPWLFARLREVAMGRPDPGPPGIAERLHVFRRHVTLIETLKNGPRTLHEVRKACAWYARGLYGCNALRMRVWESTDLATAKQFVEEYFAQLIERQSRLGLSPEMAPGRDEIDAGFDASSGGAA